jgi:hypothetical protein
MSTHPNTMLILALTPNDLARKTYRAILAEAGIEDDEQIKVGNDDYFIQVMEEDYDESNQLSAKEGNIVLYDLVTYGYGEKITWEKLTEQKQALEKWAKGVCARHKCSYQIFIGANYW